MPKIPPGSAVWCPVAVVHESGDEGGTALSLLRSCAWRVRIQVKISEKQESLLKVRPAADNHTVSRSHCRRRPRPPPREVTVGRHLTHV